MDSPILWGKLWFKAYQFHCDLSLEVRLHLLPLKNTTGAEFFPCNGVGQPESACDHSTVFGFCLLSFVSPPLWFFFWFFFLLITEHLSKQCLWHKGVKSKCTLSEVWITQNICLHKNAHSYKHTHQKRHPAGLLLCSSWCFQAKWGHAFAFGSSTAVLLKL